MPNQRRGIHIEESDLMCKNGCGFFGNASWQGYCSKCWREIYQRQVQSQIQSDHEYAKKLQEEENQARSQQQPTTNQQLPSTPIRSAATAECSTTPQRSIGTKSFSKFVEKREQAKNFRTKTFKNFFSPTSSDSSSSTNSTPQRPPPPQRSGSVGGESLNRYRHFLGSSHTRSGSTSSSTETPPPPVRQQSFESKKASKRFTAFLKKIDADLARKILSICRPFWDRVTDRVVAMKYTMRQRSDMVQDFYTELHEHIKDHPFVSNNDDSSDEEHNNNDNTTDIVLIMDEVERFVTTRLYRDVFCNDITEDENEDLSIQTRIRNLHWVSPGRLGATLDEKNELVNTAIDSAFTAIIEMDSKRAPQDKLQCVTTCAKHVFEAIKLSKKDESSSGADDFLPALIWVIISANPPLLKSNMHFIMRFAKNSRINTGEAAYYFTHLCCAVSYIEGTGINAESLNLTQDQFDSYMRGETPVLDDDDDEDDEEEEDPLETMRQNLVQIEDLQQKTDDLNAEADEIRASMEAHSQRIEEVTASYISGSSALDSDITVDNLPEPLIPTTSARSPRKQS